MADRLLQLLNEHRALIYKVARLYASNSEDQKDLFQDILVAVWQSWPRFENRSQFSTWLYRVALNTALSWNRREKKRQAIENQLEWYDPSDDPRQEQIELLYRQMRRLEPISRMLLSLRLDGYELPEIAEISGMTINHVSVKIHRAKQLLTTWIQSTPIR
jgi:RNA polymerase sigma-70 factor (ECF subfamily)